MPIVWPEVETCYSKRSEMWLMWMRGAWLQSRGAGRASWCGWLGMCVCCWFYCLTSIHVYIANYVWHLPFAQQYFPVKSERWIGETLYPTPGIRCVVIGPKHNWSSLDLEPRAINVKPRAEFSQPLEQWCPVILDSGSCSTGAQIVSYICQIMSALT